MNYRLIFKLIGNVLKIEALLMLFPLLVSFIYGSGDHSAFLWSIIILASVGIVLAKLNPKDKNFRTRDAFVVAGFSWILLSFRSLALLFFRVF